MFSSFLYRNLCVSNTAASNSTYPNRVLEAADLLPHRNRGADNTVHSHAEITLAEDGRPKHLHEQAINTGA